MGWLRVGKFIPCLYPKVNKKVEKNAQAFGHRLHSQWKTVVFKTFFKTKKQNNLFPPVKTEGGIVEAAWVGGGQGSSAGAEPGWRWNRWG